MRRPGRATAAAALVLAGASLPWLVAGWAGRGFPAPLAWALWLAVPVAAARWRGHALDSAVARAFTALLLAGFVARVAGLGLAAGAAVGFLAAAAVAASRPGGSGCRLGRAEAASLGIVACAIAFAMWRWPAGVGLHTDVPAHLAGIHDALALGAWQPSSWVPGEGLRPDLRFGVLHGWIAAMAHAGGVPPWELLRAGPILTAPLFLLCLYFLGRALGLRWWLALACAASATVLGEGGRGSGLWSSVYPGTLVLALAWLALARWIRGARFEAAILLVASAAAHPFGWIAGCLVAAHGVVFLGLRRRGAALRSLSLPLGTMVVGGVLLLLPSLRWRGELAGAIHALPMDVLFWAGGLFTADPLAMVRWASLAAILCAPLALAHAARSRGDGAGGGARWALLLALPTWTIALDPLLAPLAWEGAGYLVVRLARLLPPELLLGLLLASAMRGRPSPRWGTLALASLLLFAIAADRPWPRPTPGADRPWPWAARVVEAGPGEVASDPRSSYALRAAGLRRASCYPVPHASPLDADLPRRLAAWRMFVAGGGEAWREAVGELQAESIWLPAREEALYGDGEWGYHPRPWLVRARLEQLRAAGAEPGLELEEGALFRVEDLRDLELVPLLDASPAPGRNWPADPDAAPLAGELQLGGTSLPRGPLRPGGSIALELFWRHGGRRPGLVPTTGAEHWPRLRLQFERVEPRGARWWRLLASAGRDPQRFAREFTPFDGFPVVAGEGGLAAEGRVLAIPPYLEPGEYELRASVHEAGWRPRRQLGNFLGAGQRPGSRTIGRVVVEKEVGAR